MRKTILAIVIGLLFASGIVVAQMGGGMTTPNFWKLTGDDISPISDDWNVVMGNVTIGGVTTGDLDMGTDLIFNIGATGTDFTSGGGLNLVNTLNCVTTNIDGVLTATSTVDLATTTIQNLTVTGTSSFTAVTLTDLTLTGDLDVNGTTSLATSTIANLTVTGTSSLATTSITGDLGVSGVLELQTDQYLNFNADDGTHKIGVTTGHGSGVIYTDYSELSAKTVFNISANSGENATGTWEPYFSMGDSGKVFLQNTTQGNVGDKYFEVDMTDGLWIKTAGSKRAILMADNVTSTDKTFQFPNITGTFLMATGTQDIETSGDFTLTGTTSFATVNTGQGDYELYAMNQDIESSDTVEFAKIGIGEANPTTTLDVAGMIRALESTSTACNATTEGNMLYDSTDKHFYGCDGTNWLQLDTSFQ